MTRFLNFWPIWMLAGITVIGYFPRLAQTQPAVQSATNAPIDWPKAQKFWSFQKPIAHSRPAVKNTTWPREPMDHFILSRLETIGLAPSPQADKRTLIRRVSFDLTGLPPTAEEVQTFLEDLQPGAYQRLV